MLKHGGPKMKRKVNKDVKARSVTYEFIAKMCINCLVSQCAVLNNESLYHDIQNDEVMCQTIQGFVGYRNPFNSRQPQHHASMDTRGNNGQLCRHNG